jgi:hypothetical protein
MANLFFSKRFTAAIKKAFFLVYEGLYEDAQSTKS